MTDCAEMIPDSQPDVGEPTEHQCKKNAVNGSKYCSQHKKQHPEEKAQVISG